MDILFTYIIILPLIAVISTSNCKKSSNRLEYYRKH